MRGFIRCRGCGVYVPDTREMLMHWGHAECVGLAASARPRPGSREEYLTYFRLRLAAVQQRQQEGRGERVRIARRDATRRTYWRGSW
jgi:hypothetical protein